MPTHAIIDADTIVYAVGFAHDKATEENDGVEEPLTNLYSGVKLTIESLLSAVGADSYELFLTGKTNFRVDIYPEYKANRVGTPQPTRKKEVIEYMVKHKGAVIVDGFEADDACGIAMYSKPVADTVLIHQDKDLNMLRGNHLNWHKAHRANGIYNISERVATETFYKQLLKGDWSVDNIPGLYRMTGVKATQKILDGVKACRNEREMWEYCVRMYGSAEVAERIAQLIYIWRDSSGWVNPTKRKGTV